MKKMKKLAYVFAFCSMILVLATLFVGCNQAPTKKQIKNDIQENILNKRFAFEITLKDYEIELSQTKDEIYTATINATAKSTYADFSVSIDMEYQKYDQGWLLENYKCSDYIYEQTRYPNKNDVKKMINEQNLQDMEQLDISYERGAIVYRGKAKSDWSPFVSGEAISVVTWEYNVNKDNWEYKSISSENGNFQLTKAFEGKWQLWNESGYILIENVTDNGFDITYQSGYCNFSSTHFSFKNGTISSDGLSLKLSNEKVTFNKDAYGRADFEIFLSKEPKTSRLNGKLSDISFTLRIDNKSFNGFNFYSSSVIELSSNIIN